MKRVILFSEEVQKRSLVPFLDHGDGRWLVGL